MTRPDDLKRADAQKLVARLATTSGNVHYSEHALEKMEERDITTTHVLNTLRRGAIVEGPYVSPEDDWRMNFSYRTAGMAITVTVAIDWPSDVVIVTAF